MIKINVITNNINWFNYIKKPNYYLDKKIDKLNLKDLKFRKKNFFFTLLLSGDKEIKYLNKKFRKKNIVTDILSFPFQTKRELQKKLKNNKEVYLGDIIINLNKIKRKNLRKNFKQLPLYMKHMKNRDTFSRYIYDLHELINKMLGKKSGLSYDDVRQRYEHFRARCGKSIQVENLIIKTNTNNSTRKQSKKHKGCVQPLHKVKSKGVVNIVPVSTKCDSISVDTKCFDVNL